MSFASVQTYDEHRLWGQRFLARLAGQRELVWQNTPSTQRPIRIGYVSADFFTHSVSYFIEAPIKASVMDCVMCHGLRL